MSSGRSPTRPVCHAVGSKGITTTYPTSIAPSSVAAGAVEVESRELVRRLRAAGLRLTPAQRRARSAHPLVTLIADRGASPSRSRGQWMSSPMTNHSTNSTPAADVRSLISSHRSPSPSSGPPHGADGRHHEGAETPGVHACVGETLGDLDGVVGLGGAADDRDAHATPLVIEEKDDRLGDRWTFDREGDDRQRLFGAFDGIDTRSRRAVG